MGYVRSESGSISRSVWPGLPVFGPEWAGCRLGAVPSGGRDSVIFCPVSAFFSGMLVLGSIHLYWLMPEMFRLYIKFK